MLIERTDSDEMLIERTDSNDSFIFLHLARTEVISFASSSCRRSIVKDLVRSTSLEETHLTVPSLIGKTVPADLALQSSLHVSSMYEA